MILRNFWQLNVLWRTILPEFCLMLQGCRHFSDVFYRGLVEGAMWRLRSKVARNVKRLKPGESRSNLIFDLVASLKTHGMQS